MDTLKYLEEKLEYFREPLIFVIDDLNIIIKKLDQLLLFKFSNSEQKRKIEKEKILDFLSTIEEKIKKLIEKIQNIFVNNLEEIKYYFLNIKKENYVKFQIYNCYFYLKDQDLINKFLRLLSKKKENKLLFLSMIDKFLMYINKELQIINNYLIDTLEFEKEKDFKEKVKKLKNEVEKLNKFLIRELDHLDVIIFRINEIRKLENEFKINKIIFSKKALGNIKEIFNKSKGQLKLLIVRIKELLKDSNQIAVIGKIDNITIAKYPRGHTNLRIILDYDKYKEGILFILDITLHNKEYENWHNNVLPSDSLTESLILDKDDLIILYLNENCGKIIYELF